MPPVTRKPFKSSTVQTFKVFGLVFVLTLELLNLLNLGRAAAQTPPFYQGKTLSIIVGSKAGDVYDLYPRLLAEYLPNIFPAIPTSSFRMSPARLH